VKGTFRNAKICWKERIRVKVGIVGAGAVGLLIGFYLHHVCDVTIYTKRKSQANLLNEKGLKLIKGGKQETRFIKAQHIHATMKWPDVLFVTVKQYDLPELIASQTSIQDAETVIFLQNGMGHLHILETLKNDNIVLGVVEHGALKHDDRTIEHTGEGKINLAVWRGELGGARQFIDGNNNFPFFYNGDWYNMLAHKLAVNAVINPLTALLRVRNGRLISVSEYKEMMKAIFEEVKQVLELTDDKHIWDNIVQIAEKTAANKSSMLKDLEKGNKTEIDAILGYIIGKGISMHTPTPLCSFLYSAIKGMEHGGSENE